MENQNNIQDVQAVHCPNCDAVAVKDGMTIICPVCDVTWRFTKEGNKIERTGEFSDLRSRVHALEQKIGAPAPQPKPEPAPQPDDSAITVVHMEDLDDDI